MFSDDSSHSESEFYRPDELNFLENEPVSASTSHNHFKNVNNSEEITSDIIYRLGRSVPRKYVVSLYLLNIKFFPFDKNIYFIFANLGSRNFRFYVFIKYDEGCGIL